MALEGVDFQHADLRGPETWDAEEETLAIMRDAASTPPDNTRGLLSQGEKDAAWADALRMIWEMAEHNPDAWRCLCAYLGHLSEWWLKRAGRVNPRADPHASHGEKCYNAGAHAALEVLASKILDPAYIGAKVDELRTGKQNRRTYAGRE